MTQKQHPSVTDTDWSRIKQGPYERFLHTLRSKDRPGPVTPRGVIASFRPNFAGNFMATPMSSWANPETAPPPYSGDRYG